MRFCLHCGEDLDLCDCEEPWPNKDDNKEGCQFPGRCIMPGPHLASECHTVEMMEAFEKEQEK